MSFNDPFKKTEGPKNRDGNLERDMQGLRALDQKFAELPETNEPMNFSVGETVRFPDGEGSANIADWNIVRAEKSHYWMERAVGEKFDHVMCSDQELAEHNQK